MKWLSRGELAGRRFQRGLAAEMRDGARRARRLKRGVIGVVAPLMAIATWLLSGLPAVAADYLNNFDINGPSGYGGTGRTYGEITFYPSPKTKVSVGGAIGDICDAGGGGDGYGWQMQLYTLQNNGAYWRKTNIMHDTTGCGDGYQIYNYPQDFFAPSAINKSRAELWATDPANNPLYVVTTSVWKAHP